MDTRHPRLEFPDPDLLTSLIDIYFEHVNPFTALLHAPSFRRSVEDGLHLRDDGFGQVTLMLCAIAARFSDDPRVLLDGGHDQSLHSAGWKWFSQVEVTRRSLLTPPCLYDLQIYCVSFLSLFLITPFHPASCGGLKLAVSLLLVACDTFLARILCTTRMLDHDRRRDQDRAGCRRTSEEGV